MNAERCRGLHSALPTLKKSLHAQSPSTCRRPRCWSRNCWAPQARCISCAAHTSKPDALLPYHTLIPQGKPVQHHGSQSMHSERESLPCLRKPQGNFDPVHSTSVVLHIHYHSNQGERHGGSASVTATLGEPQKRKGCANEKMSAGGRALHLLPHSWHACPSLRPHLATAAPLAHLPSCTTPYHEQQVPAP